MLHGACPISQQQTNTFVTRLVSMAVFCLSIVALFFPTSTAIILGVLTVDFALRGFVKKFSPIGWGAHIFCNLMRAGEKVNAGPKIFAAKVGFWLSVIAWISWGLEIQKSTILCLVALLIASGLEAFFEICIGCKIFPLWQKIAGSHRRIRR